eukprot:gene3687-3946_t
MLVRAIILHVECFIPATIAQTFATQLNSVQSVHQGLKAFKFLLSLAYAGRKAEDLFTYSFADTPSEAFVEAVSEVSLVPGLQDFAASVWEQRQAAMPGQADPLDFLFSEFDEDGDGSLTSVEIANALRSKGVEVLPRQVQKFID